jgi:hypothetical protein
MSLFAKPRRLVVLALPLGVLLAMVIRSELILARGAEFVVGIDGYDPRDLLRGQFLRYRVRWNWSTDERAPWPGSCLCLERDAGPVDPRVAPRSCDSVQPCAAFINPAALDRLERYYIPEGMGPPLERAIRERRASLRIAIDHAGDVVVRDLLVDGKPWRAVLPR